ncbi:MAG: transglycosylase SLT domain-containing protein [Bacteroidales bacterium]|nr:transglycosylase SLT domain-containing protein [Bacteroidales bacterium]
MNRPTHRFNIFRAILLGLVLAAIAFGISWKLFDREEQKTDSLRRIQERGYLIALTDRNTLNYFVYRGEPMGYQLELLESFARYLKVPLRIISADDINRLEYYLFYNAADLIALNIPLSRQGKKNIQYSLPFGETRLVLVQKKPSGNGTDPPLVKSLKDFPTDTVYVRSNPFLSPMYHHFYKETRGRAVLKEVRDESQEDLIRQVSKGLIRFAICQENVAMAFKRYYYNTDISVLAFPLFFYGWGVNHESDSLRMMLDSWLTTIKRTGEYKQIYLDYFDNQRLARFMQSGFCSMNTNRLSPFDESIQKYSIALSWDWRLVASLIYEESNFRQGQVSKYNASGLMQLMPETAARFGIDSASTPARQIEGGVKYLRYLDTQIPDEITNPLERINFVLAAYNVGIGRVLAAREKAGQYGRDKNRWNRHVDYYLLRRSKKNPHGLADTMNTFTGDYKTEGFVDDIITRYYHYRNLISERLN